MALIEPPYSSPLRGRPGGGALPRVWTRGLTASLPHPQPLPGGEGRNCRLPHHPDGPGVFLFWTVSHVSHVPHICVRAPLRPPATPGERCALSTGGVSQPSEQRQRLVRAGGGHKHMIVVQCCNHVAGDPSICQQA